MIFWFGNFSFLVLSIPGIPPELLPITGCPHAVPSITTNPNGSSLEGIKETSAKFCSLQIILCGCLPTKFCF